jgi:uncharacterized Zn finger protein
MLESETKSTRSPSAPVLSNCPQCDAELVILRVLPGKSGSEYWTLRCIGCGGIHLDIVKTSPQSPSTKPLA